MLLHGTQCMINHPMTLRLVSWNLFHHNGANLEELLHLLDLTQPDILLMQEARHFTASLTKYKGGFYHRLPLDGWNHGTACWSHLPFAEPPYRHDLPSGMIIKRHAQILHFQAGFGLFSLANVHLSHRQWLNRRQLRATREALGPYAAIIGDFNMVGPATLRDFHDIGPRQKTHKMLNHVPLRLDRCLVRGLIAEKSSTLPRFGSDHHPIMLTLLPIKTV